MKKILVIYYSQTGQTENAIKSILSTLPETVQIDYYPITLENNYPFPWKVDNFFAVMPDSVLEEPVPIKPLPLNSSKEYDLIVLGYQPWFLSISLPMLSFLKTEQANVLLKNKPILTVLTCRNMWLNAHKHMEAHLKSLNAPLVGNIVLADEHYNAVSFITIIRWLIFGRKEAGAIFPHSGITDNDLTKASRFGPLIEKHLENDELQSLDKALQKERSIPHYPELAFVEKNAFKRFKLFAKFANREQKSNLLSRRARLRIFMYLLFLIAIISFPILSLVELTMNIKRKYTTYNPV